MIVYKYQNAEFENRTENDIEQDAVFEKLFEDGVVDEPSLNYELKRIAEFEELDVVEVKSVTAKHRSDKKVRFVVRTDNPELKFMADNHSDSMRVAHQTGIDGYEFFDVNLVS